MGVRILRAPLIHRPRARGPGEASPIRPQGRHPGKPRHNGTHVRRGGVSLSTKGPPVYPQLNHDAIAQMARDGFEARAKRYCIQINLPMHRVVDLADMGGSTIYVEADRIAGELAFRLYHDVYCAGEASTTVDFEASFRVHATWVDAFKDRFARWIPSWYLRRRPIQWRTLTKSESRTVDARALLPRVPVNTDRVLFFAGTRS